jgi:hypothetical protein
LIINDNAFRAVEDEPEWIGGLDGKWAQLERLHKSWPQLGFRVSGLGGAGTKNYYRCQT